MNVLQQEKPSAIGPAALGAAEDRDIAGELMAGAMRRELGLKTEDLRIGLTVARNLLGRGRMAEALRIYVALVLCDPLEVDFQIGLANCASGLEEHAVALQAASAAIALAPSDSRGYLLSGRSCIHLGLLVEAEQDLGDALDLAVKTEQTAVQREARLLLSRLTAARG